MIVNIKELPCTSCMHVKICKYANSINSEAKLKSQLTFILDIPDGIIDAAIEFKCHDALYTYTDAKGK